MVDLYNWTAYWRKPTEISCVLKVYGRAADYVSSGVNVRDLAAPKGSVGLSTCAQSFWQGGKYMRYEHLLSVPLHTTHQGFPSYLQLMEWLLWDAYKVSGTVHSKQDMLKSKRLYVRN